jgi:caa(3)-type oxidase subunit IV
MEPTSATTPAAHEHPHTPDHDVAHHVDKHVKGYLLVGALLLFCTGLTVFLSYVNFGTQKANIVVAMAVAAFKAGCVAAIFMHLKSEKWTIYRVLLITIFFALDLFLLTALAFHDPIRLN